MGKALTLEEQKIILEKIKIDKTCFGEIYDAYFDEIYSYIERRVDNEENAYDIAAKTFYNALNTIEKFKFKGISISSRLYKIASNEMKKYYRKSSLFPKVDLTPFEDFIADEVTADTDLKEKEFDNFNKNNYNLLKKALEKLKPTQKETLILRFWEKKSIKEISQITGQSESNTKVILHRSTKKLQKILPNNMLDYD
ncbi:MAG: sigma-70 family RNA polymerase sigma factor [Candidatus Gracilibacteria bacterium]|nr:sigma-70 family RNA polymerase sigma factor [Candidatus Gracilibacteria bacterium]